MGSTLIYDSCDCSPPVLYRFLGDVILRCALFACLSCRKIGIAPLCCLLLSQLWLCAPRLPAQVTECCSVRKISRQINMRKVSVSLLHPGKTFWRWKIAIVLRCTRAARSAASLGPSASLYSKQLIVLYARERRSAQFCLL